jgi:DNA-directed RNA polymerase specialized sigma24 family protein
MNLLERQWRVSRAEAEEALQGCFEQLARPRAFCNVVLEPEDSFGAWLTTRARYALLKHWTQERRHKRLLDAPVENPTPRQIKFDEQKACLHFELSEWPRDRHDMKTPEGILAEDSDAKFVGRLFAKLEPQYRRRGRGLLFEHLKATLLAQRTDSDREVNDRLKYLRGGVGQAKSRIKKKLCDAAHALEKEARARHPQQLFRGAAGTPSRATTITHGRERRRDGSLTCSSGPR